MYRDDRVKDPERYKTYKAVEAERSRERDVAMPDPMISLAIGSWQDCEPSSTGHSFFKHYDVNITIFMKHILMLRINDNHFDKIYT